MESPADAVDKVFDQFKQEPRTEQKSVILKLIEGHDVACILPTGAGKSHTFMTYPLVMDRLHPDKAPHTAIVIMPLVALMKNMCTLWSEMGVSVVVLTKLDEMSADDKAGILTGKFSVILSSPEAILTTFGLEVVAKNKAKTTLLAFDEAHVIVDWGKSFRESYMEVTRLTSILTDPPILLCSATLTKDMLENVTKILCITDYETVSVLPDRANIMLHISTDKRCTIESSLGFYLSKFEDTPREAPKALLFVRTLDSIFEVYRVLITWLRDRGVHEPQLYVDFFHGEHASADSDVILDDFLKHDSDRRLLVCTVAFGMGINIPDIRFVFHWGPPSSILDYWQQVGRCARDTLQGDAYLFTPTRSVNKKIVNDSMIDLVRSDKCIRLEVLNALKQDDTDYQAIQDACGKDKCCSRCSEREDL